MEAKFSLFRWLRWKVLRHFSPGDLLVDSRGRYYRVIARKKNHNLMIQTQSGKIGVVSYTDEQSLKLAGVLWEL